MAEMREITASAQLHIADATDVMLSPIDIEYQTSRYDEAAELAISGLTDLADDDVASRWPEESRYPVGITVDVNETRLAAGTLDTGNTDAEGLWSGEAYDAVRDLAQSTTTAEYRGEDIVTVVEDIFSQADIPAADESAEDSDVATGTPTYNINTPDNYEEAIQGEAGPQLLTAYRVSTSFNTTPTQQALTTALDRISWHWWVDVSNTIQVAPGFDSEEFQAQYILETSAGIQSPPYQSVVITGARRPLGSAPGGLEGPRQNVIGKGVPIRVRAPEGGGEPVFRYTDRSISTVERAQRVAQQIWEEMVTQRRSGSITMLGNPSIRPLDGLRIPDHMGGESYLVSALTTKVNNSDGFIQEVDVGGLIDAGPEGELADESVEVISGEEGFGEGEGGSDDSTGGENGGDDSLVDENPASDDT